MVKRTAQIRNAFGIHVRPSAVIVKRAREYTGTIEVTSERGNCVDAKNLLGVISLGVTQGQIVTLTVDGADEKQWAAIMVELFETEFDFART